MRILLIEDDIDLCDAVGFALKKEGYTVDICNEGDDGLRMLRQRAHDLVLLDRMLPRMDGIRVLKIARSEGIITPVLMMTAMGKTQDLVEGLDHGADDYIVKPFVVDELLARIRAMSRRPRSFSVSERISYKNMVFDPAKKLLSNSYKDKKISLSNRESALMEMLIKNVGTAIPRATLFAYVWGTDAPIEDGILDNYVSFLRRRLRSVDSTLEIHTLRGVGFSLEDMEDAHV